MNLVEIARNHWQKRGLQDTFEQLKGDGRFSTNLICDPSKNDQLSIGSTRIGGHPDLPTDFEWPYSGNDELRFPMSFIAQINLDEIAAHTESNNELPKSGILFFFRNDSEDIAAYGYDAEDFSHSLVFHYTGPVDSLSPREFPPELESYMRHPSCAVNLISEFSLPTSELSPWGAPLERDDYDDDHWEDIYALTNIYPRSAQLLGHPNYVQGSTEVEAAEAAEQSDSADISEDLKQKLSAPFGRNPKDWRLLLAVDSIDECEMMWGDMGTIYFMITHEDLKQGRFDRVNCVFQCG